MPLSDAERAYLIRYQPTRAMQLGLIPYPETCNSCGFADKECVCC